jgi:putative DNA primase/helicase
MTIIERHAEYLRDQAAIPLAVAEQAGIRSALSVDDLPEHARSWGDQALPAIVFPYRSPGGTVIEQVKPDEPIWYNNEAKPRKYLLAEGSGSILNAVRPDPEAKTVVLVEGTKQTFSVAAHAPAGVAVYGIAGCRSWSEAGVPIAALRLVEGKDVVVIFDADFRDNLDVWAAGERLGGVLRDEGAHTVKYAKLNAAAKVGIDDLLASKEDDEHRRTFLANVIANADAKLPPRPKGKRPEPGVEDVFDGEKLLALRAARAIDKVRPAALTEEKVVALYRDGYFDIDRTAIIGACTTLLGDSMRTGHRATIEETLVGLLVNEERFLPTYAGQPMVNVKNGMLDLPTETLKPHDPIYLSAQQLPVAWDPDAKCPAYERWIEACGVADQIDDLEEVASMMLDPSRTPTKALFLFGPSRSGKSTFLRVLEALAGRRNRSAITLHQLVESRFSAARVFGKILNVAADLSSAHVEDISIFKMLTGEDAIEADRKYGKQFDFTNRALFAFSANELPTVGEGSRAYVERIKPFEFPVSFAGREDPTIEDAIMQELPGILTRLVRAWRRRQERGRYLPTNPRVQKEFETRSDRVRQFVAERCLIHGTTVDGRPVGHGTCLDENRASTKKQLIEAFNEWVSENNGSRLNARKITDRIKLIDGVHEVRRMPTKAWALNVTVRDDEDEIWPGEEPPNMPGGGFDASGGGFEGSGGETATETATGEVEVGDSKQDQVAEVAISTPIVTTSHRDVRAQVTDSEVVGGLPRGSGDSGIPEVATMGKLIATSATSTIRRPDLDRVEKAMKDAGAFQPRLIDSDSAQPSSGGPIAPRRRILRPADQPGIERAVNALDPAGSPLAALLPGEDLQMTCPRCRGRKDLVPPTRFWYACPSCFPETFGV